MKGGSYLLVVALALAMASAMLWGSGFADAVGANQNNDELRSAADDAADKSAAERGAPGGGSIFGLVIFAARQLFNFVTLPLLLPVRLTQIGFPQWFAYPVGIGTQVVLSISIIQFLAGRVFR